MGFLQRIRSEKHLALAAILAGVVSSCAPKFDEEENYIGQCTLASDQSATLYGRWKKVAVPIAFRAGHWNASEMSAIMDAADVWNKFYGAIGGGKVIDYGSRNNPNTLSWDKPLSDLCGYTIYDESSNRFTSGALLYKRGTWPYPAQSQAVALTSFCRSGNAGGSLQAMTMGLIEVNYQNFFGAGKKQPDLKSIFVHELGHLLGLDHSCDISTSKAGMAQCSSVISSKPSYYEAALFPTVLFNNGVQIVKDAVMTNDQERGACLYGGGAL